MTGPGQAASPGGRLRARMARLTTALSPLSLPSAFGWTVLAIYVPVVLASQLLSDARVMGGSPRQWVIAVLVSVAFFILAFRATGIALRRFPAPSPYLVLLLYALIDRARALVLGVTLEGLDATDGSYIAYRLVSVLYNGVILGSIGYAVGRYELHQQAMAALERQRERLLAIQKHLDESLERLRAELAAAVRSAIEPSLRAFDLALAGTAQSSARDQAALALQDLIDQRLRPLSRELSEQRGDPVEDIVAHARQHRRRVPLPSHVRVAVGLRPGLVALLTLMLGTPVAVRDLGLVAALPYLLMIPLVTGTLLGLAALAMRKLVLRTGLAVAVIVSLHASASVIVIASLNLLDLPVPRAAQPVGAIVFGIVGAAVILSALVEERRLAAEHELALVNAELEEVIALVRRRDLLVRRRLARVMHGSVQGELYAAAVRLQSTHVPTQADLVEAQASVAAALRHLDDDPPATGRTRGALDAYVDTWRGLREIRASLGPAVERTLAADPETDEAVAEVVKEAVNNAIRHGRASRVDITITYSDAATASSNPSSQSHATARRQAPSLIQPGLGLTIADDGQQRPGDGRRGQGSELYDAMCRSWSLTHEADGSIFRGEVPLPPISKG